MKKIIILMAVIFSSVSCSNVSEYRLPNGGKSINYSEQSRKSMFDRLSWIDGDYYYYAGTLGQEKKLKLKYYNTFKQAYVNKCNSKKKKYDVLKNIKIFNHPKSINEYISITKGKKGKIYLTRDVVVYKKEKISCSIINDSLVLEKKEPIDKYVKKEYLVMERIDSIKLPNSSENNRIYGITTDSKVSLLRVENKKPNGIEEFEIDNTKYYFWYYNNLISKKEVDEYDIRYDK